MALTPGAGYIPNPSLPIVYLWIDGKELTLKDGRPERLLQMEYNRICNVGGNRFSITLFDPTWTLIESDVTTMKDRKFQMQYGYSGGLLSPIWEVMILDYKATFSFKGVQILIEGVSTGTIDPKDRQRSRSFPAATTKDQDATVSANIGQIVASIAKQRNWDTDIEPTKDWLDNHDLELAEAIKAHFMQPNMKDLDFIANVLRPRAISLTDQGDYKVYFTDTPGKPVLHFRPPKFEPGKPVKIFTFMRQSMSEVLEFSPDVNSQVMIQVGAGTVSCPYINEQTGEYDYAYANNSTTPNKINLGGPFTGAEDPTGEDHNVVLTTPANTKEQAEVLARNAYLTQYNSAHSAILTIVGDPRDYTQKVIQVNVVLPTGKFHYTSGLWYVIGSTDQISSGQYTTQMELIRNSYTSNDGNTDLVKAEGKVLT